MMPYFERAQGALHEARRLLDLGPVTPEIVVITYDYSAMPAANMASYYFGPLSLYRSHARHN